MQHLYDEQIIQALISGAQGWGISKVSIKLEKMADLSKFIQNLPDRIMWKTVVIRLSAAILFQQVVVIESIDLKWYMMYDSGQMLFLMQIFTEKLW